MNSHKPTDRYLIPTTLTPQVPAGFELLDTLYPDGQEREIFFSPNKPLSVYTGKVTLKLSLFGARRRATWSGLDTDNPRYQACNDTTCLQPVKVPVDAKLTVAEAGAKSHPTHTEIFSAGPPKARLFERFNRRSSVGRN